MALRAPTSLALKKEPPKILRADELIATLFARAGALEMEVGGVLSHGAVVARELGLPAVAGLHGAVKSFRTGQRLRVDGRLGPVTVLKN